MPKSWICTPGASTLGGNSRLTRHSPHERQTMTTAAPDLDRERKLAADIKLAAQAQLILNFEAAAPMEWLTAIDFLIATSEFDAARFAARQILALRSNDPYAH